MSDKKRWLKKNLGLALVIISLLILIPVIVSQIGPPLPKNVVGFIFFGEGGAGVPNGTIVRIVDTTPDPDLEIVTYTDAPPTLQGAYSAEIPGANTSDTIVVTSFNATAYGRSWAVLGGTTTYVNVSLNITRPSETSINITNPSNHSLYNISSSFYVNATVGVLGGSNGVGCQATIYISDDTIINVSEGQLLTNSLGAISLGSTVDTAWNMTTSGIVGTVTINVSSSCTSDGENFESLDWDFIINISTEDNIPPKVYLNSPYEGDFVNTSTVIYYFNVTDYANISNCTLILDNFVNNTIDEGIFSDGSGNNITVENMGEGRHNWTVNCTDIYNNIGTNNTPQTFYVDLYPPAIELNYPEDWRNQTNDGNSDFNWTATDTLDDELLCNLSLDNSLRAINYSSPTGEEVGVRITDLYDGLHEWNVTCWDNATNINVSESRILNISVPMFINLTYPPIDNLTNNNDVEFYFNVTDNEPITNCTLLVDGIVNESNSTGITRGAINNISVMDLEDGYHTWAVSCTNILNVVENSTIFNLTVDSTPPTVNLVYPPNNSDYNGTIVNFSWIAEDNLFDPIFCNLTVDGAFTDVNVSSINGSVTSIIRTVSLGYHEWNVTCWDNATNVNTSVSYFFNISLPDLVITNNDITFNNSNPTENEDILINAAVNNTGNFDTLNVNVTFYNGNPSIDGYLIGSGIANISAGGAESINISWNISVGENYIYVHVDPPIATNGSINETNETNNDAFKVIVVDIWHLIYGYVNDAFLELEEDIANKSLFRWSVDSFNGTNIFVADKDSQISFLDLRALGTNSSGSNTSNDFAEADRLLNMSAFSFSLANIYTLDGTRLIENSSYLMFNQNVTSIPLTNSTNNTNFKTGILWDSSDDVGDGEFSEDDVEDLLFITQIKEDTIGTYGQYDYELRIPSTLRTYIRNDLETVVFYTDLI